MRYIIPNTTQIIISSSYRIVKPSFFTFFHHFRQKLFSMKRSGASVTEAHRFTAPMAQRSIFPQKSQPFCLHFTFRTDKKRFMLFVSFFAAGR